ncbi:hypothetical protein A3A20_03095 [Candidatus Wolfebacteria bacterium RIFCSPLOWO2_01_FULL_45_19]|uniref:N-acetyltransferase domain-containing protein n=1 Tax=Candidatus Wolfebacteria bacterium RIFCSPLOWO2_01_FULL_45_19 TaxID=1802557 RepID=A0A1F8DSH3_9BACT|nr:MAG: hypothetical protein UX23_C0008G0019 [Parcubacteria group bacterium GW2011_GWB1_45_9]OGM90775.1 MAG: hypothetical protein A3A20_03095 [Candidatus Wolfebacteria bacterium RIFCSPLOWO2_01_FULL_45_19]
MLQIRRLKRNQVDEKLLSEINRLWLQLSPDSEPLTLARLKEIARQRFYCMAILKNRSEPAKIAAIGSIHFVRDFHGLIGYVNNVVVNKNCRYAGIGTKIEEHFTELAKIQGAKFIDATSNDKHAPEFWLKHGWQKRETNVFRKYL